MSQENENIENIKSQLDEIKKSMLFFRSTQDVENIIKKIEENSKQYLNDDIQAIKKYANLFEEMKTLELNQELNTHEGLVKRTQKTELILKKIMDKSSSIDNDDIIIGYILEKTNNQNVLGVTSDYSIKSTPLIVKKNTEILNLVSNEVIDYYVNFEMFHFLSSLKKLTISKSVLESNGFPISNHTNKNLFLISNIEELEIHYDRNSIEFEFLFNVITPLHKLRKIKFVRCDKDGGNYFDSINGLRTANGKYTISSVLPNDCIKREHTFSLYKNLKIIEIPVNCRQQEQFANMRILIDFFKENNVEYIQTFEK